MAWPLNGSEAGVTLLWYRPLYFGHVNAPTIVSIRTAWFTQQKEWGLYQNKVTSTLAAIKRPDHSADNCKMACVVLKRWETKWKLLSFYMLLKGRRDEEFTVYTLVYGRQFRWALWNMFEVISKDLLPIKKSSVFFLLFSYVVYEGNVYLIVTIPQLWIYDVIG